MPRDELLPRPHDWPEWYPENCPTCSRPLRPGKVRLVGWKPCACPGAEHGGHHKLCCAWDIPGPNACRWSMAPPGHTAEYERPERWGVSGSGP